MRYTRPRERDRGARRSHPPPDRRAARRRGAERRRDRVALLRQPPGRLAASARPPRARARARARAGAAAPLLARPRPARGARRVARALPRLLDAAARRPRHPAAASAPRKGATMTVTEQGEVRPDEDRCAVRFERLYDFTADELWRAISEPEQLRGWLGPTSRWTLVPGEEYELDVGGRTWGRLREVQPGRVLELDWNHGDELQSVLRLEVVPREHGALLVLDHRRLARDQAAAYGAGWHSHLDALQ